MILSVHKVLYRAYSLRIVKGGNDVFFSINDLFKIIKKKNKEKYLDDIFLAHKDFLDLNRESKYKTDLLVKYVELRIKAINSLIEKDEKKKYGTKLPVRLKFNERDIYAELVVSNPNLDVKWTGSDIFIKAEEMIQICKSEMNVTISRFLYWFFNEFYIPYSGINIKTPEIVSLTEIAKENKGIIEQDRELLNKGWYTHNSLHKGFHITLADILEVSDKSELLTTDPTDVFSSYSFLEREGLCRDGFMYGKPIKSTAEFIWTHKGALFIDFIVGDYKEIKFPLINDLETIKNNSDYGNKSILCIIDGRKFYVRERDFHIAQKHDLYSIKIISSLIKKSIKETLGLMIEFGILENTRNGISPTKESIKNLRANVYSVCDTDTDIDVKLYHINNKCQEKEFLYSFDVVKILLKKFNINPNNFEL